MKTYEFVDREGFITRIKAYSEEEAYRIYREMSGK